jgi:hypothetical protein
MAQTDRFRFGFLGQKPVQTGLARFFQFGSVLARFFFSLGLVRFSFFGFRLIKSKPNRTGRFFQNFNRFFSQFDFFGYFFFSDFLGLIGFFSFFAHLYKQLSNIKANRVAFIIYVTR